MIIILPVVFASVIVGWISWHCGFKRGKEALPQSIKKLIHAKYEKAAHEGINKKALSRSIKEAIREGNEKIAEKILDEYK